MPFREVSDILWRERRLLELLEFKLEEERLVAAAGHVGWLPAASREIDIVMAELQAADLARAVAVQALATELGAAAPMTLKELADAAPAPWDGIFTRHRDALLTAADRVGAVAVQGEAELRRRSAAARS
jgi:hypothetical protein